MATSSDIEWTDATWNPVAGCTHASPGCDSCYAVRQTYRLEKMGQAKYAGLTVLNPKGDRHFNGIVRTAEPALKIPFGWRKPRRVFVNSMSDMFHKSVPFEFIDRVFAVMALCPQHTFQVLTKRAERMKEYCETLTRRGVLCLAASEKFGDEIRVPESFPLPNVWLGVSAENQKCMDRAMDLSACLAAVHFWSLEPLLEDLGNIRGYLEQNVEWVIIGCESRGNYPGRFADGYADAALSIIDQCKSAGVRCFHKQMPINGKVSGDPSDWPERLRIREFPGTSPANIATTSAP